MVLKNGRIVDLEKGGIYEADIEISGETITSIGSGLKGEKIIDLKGKYVIPGLIDCHVHLGTSIRDLSRFLKSGVTTVRNMIGIEEFNLNRWLGGTRVFNHLKLRDKVNAGKVPGPNIITAGPLLDGKESAFPPFLFKKITSEDEGRREVRRQWEMGYDFIKVYPALTMEAFKGITEEAEKLGIKVCGHIPYSVGLKEAKNMGLYINEHLHGVFYPLRQDIEPDTPSREGLIEFLMENNSWICPTLIAWERLGNSNIIEDLEEEVGFRNLSFRERTGMRFLNRMAVDLISKRGLKPQYTYIDELKNIVRGIKDKSTILAGTDCSLPYVVPGVSLIQEIINLGNCGLSNLEALRCGTINPAKAFLLNSGRINKGSIADIVVLEENPLESLKALYSISKTISRGVIIDYFTNETKAKKLASLFIKD